MRSNFHIHGPFRLGPTPKVYYQYILKDTILCTKEAIGGAFKTATSPEVYAFSNNRPYQVLEDIGSYSVTANSFVWDSTQQYYKGEVSLFLDILDGIEVPVKVLVGFEWLMRTTSRDWPIGVPVTGAVGDAWNVLEKIPHQFPLISGHHVGVVDEVTVGRTLAFQNGEFTFTVDLPAKAQGVRFDVPVVVSADDYMALTFGIHLVILTNNRIKKSYEVNLDECGWMFVDYPQGSE